MERRTFLSTAAVGAIAVATTRVDAAAAQRASAGELIDTNVSLGDWPVGRSVAETAAPLVAKLRRHGVTSAWTGSFEAVLSADVAAANARLAAACARAGRGVLVPFGTINPTLPDWEDDLRRCHEVHRMPGVRLHPNYHGYTLDDARFLRLLDLAARRRLLVQIPLMIEDERSQNPVLSVAPAQAAPLLDALAKAPGARVMLLNAVTRVLAPTNPLLARLAAAGVVFDIAALEGVAGIEALLRTHAGARLAFGSHAPYFYFEAALLKLEESALSPEQLAAVRSRHARAALGFDR